MGRGPGRGAPVTLDLWDYAVKIYDLPGVKDALLKLQDRYHFDVNTVIWCVWAARCGYRLEPGEVVRIQSATSAMAMHTTRPLRSVRLFLSAPKTGFAEKDLEALRADVLAAEIKSEELVLRRLDAVTRAAATPIPDDGPWQGRAEELFQTTRRNVDRPIMIANEESPESPTGLFRTLIQTVENAGP